MGGLVFHLRLLAFKDTSTVGILHLRTTNRKQAIFIVRFQDIRIGVVPQGMAVPLTLVSDSFKVILQKLEAASIIVCGFLRKG